MNLNLGFVGLKSMSQCQIIEKPSWREHSFSPIFMKLCQNVSLDEMKVRFETGSCWIKTRSNLRTPCVHSRGHSFDQMVMKICQNVNLHYKSRSDLKVGFVG